MLNALGGPEQGWNPVFQARVLPLRHEIEMRLTRILVQYRPVNVTALVNLAMSPAVWGSANVYM